MARAGYDLEGVVVAPEGGFWLASEGRPGDGRPNLLIRVDADGAVQEEVTLPEGFEDGARNNGYEGVAVGPVGGETRVVAAIQRDWEGDPANHAKLAVYDPESGAWGFVLYPMDAPSSPRGGWVGLSEIVHVGDGRYALIERDNQPGSYSTFKAVTVIDLSGVTPAPAGGELPVVEKTAAIDLLPLLRDTRGWIGDKPEGLAVGGGRHAVAGHRQRRRRRCQRRDPVPDDRNGRRPLRPATAAPADRPGASSPPRERWGGARRGWAGSRHRPWFRWWRMAATMRLPTESGAVQCPPSRRFPHPIPLPAGWSTSWHSPRA